MGQGVPFKGNPGEWRLFSNEGSSVPITGYASCNSLKPGTPEPQVDKMKSSTSGLLRKLSKKEKNVIFQIFNASVTQSVLTQTTENASFREIHFPQERKCKV